MNKYGSPKAYQYSKDKRACDCDCLPFVSRKTTKKRDWHLLSDKLIDKRNIFNFFKPNKFRSKSIAYILSMINFTDGPKD